MAQSLLGGRCCSCPPCGEGQGLGSAPSSASPGFGPQAAQREAGTQAQSIISVVACSALNQLTLCVAEDTYSSEETVDQQPVHLRVMDTADLVTSPPLQLRGQPPEKSWPHSGGLGWEHPLSAPVCCVTLSWPESLHLPKEEERGGAWRDLTIQGISSKILCSGA